LADDLEAIEHFMNWLAFIAQERDRTMTAWIFQGTQGTGKGLLMNKILAPLFGETQTVIKRASELSEKWTDFVAGKMLVFIDEVQTSAYKDEHSIISNLKNLITEPTVTVRMMNKNSYAIRNYTNWIMASNKPDPVSVDKEDRRFNVGPYQRLKLIISQAELDALPGELQDFYHYLMSYPLDKVLAATPLKSNARETLIKLSQSTSESTASAILEGDIDFFMDQLPTDDHYKLDPQKLEAVSRYRRTLFDILSRTRAGGACNIHRDELFTIFDYTVGKMNPSPASFSRFLGHRQIIVKPVLINGKTQKGITVGWKTQPTFQGLMKAHFADMKPVSQTP